MKSQTILVKLSSLTGTCFFNFKFPYVRIKKDGSIWRPKNPLYYSQEEVDNNPNIKIVDHATL